MNNENQTNIERNEQNFISMLKTCWSYLLTYWQWFLLSLIVCYALGRIYLERQPRIYSRQAVMLIEDGQDGSSGPMSSARKSRSSVSALMELNGISVGGNLKNEIFILTSIRLMERVVDTLHLDEDYTTRESLHNIPLYNNRPLEFDFARRALLPATFDAIKQEDGTVMLKNFQVGKEEMDKSLTFTLSDGETVRTPAGEMTLRIHKKTFDEFPADKTIRVSHWPVKLAAAYYARRISANEYDKESSLIVLGCQDDDPTRAEDLLRTIFEAYKQDVVDNKNRVAQNTAAFIDARIDLIGKDLSTIEENLANFKSSNRLIDFQQNAQVYLTES
ncbi:MAG: tyrosine protein kinase, partial [Bacteroidales bacterium]|nr:tyrosine protein kinase [Bacteroidales bacterium]